MLSINWSDVIDVLKTIQNHLIGLGIVVVAAIVLSILVCKLSKAKKRLFRGEALIAVVLAAVISISLMCTGPLSTMLDLASGRGKIDPATSEEATEFVTDIADEGIVLLENEGSLPLTDTKLNVFGWGSTNPCYGGTGSGALNDAYPTVTLLQGLANAGIETNAELSQFYSDYKSDRPSVGMKTQDWTLPEPNVNTYGSLVENAKSFSDTAMVVITRVGGEGADLPTDMAAVVDGSWSEVGSAYYAGTYDDTLNEGNDWDEGDHFLELSNREEEMLQMVCENFDDVIVVYNGANPFEMGFVNDYPAIKSVLWCAGTGQSGFNALGKIMQGEVNPSGRLIDTFVYDMESAPTWNNFGDFTYTNADEFMVTGASFSAEEGFPTFINYVEGIYVGYKFYETAAVEGLINYEETVQYPFGYGLSYTSFEQDMSPITEADGALNFSVTVKNTGSVAGKDVVEVYSNPPYTSGGIEKASANLVDFEKTEILEPGASQTIEFSIAVEDLASYDDNGAGCYVLEAGDYILSINADSHTVMDSETYTLAETITYDENNKRESDEVAAVNQFDFAEGDVEYLSRAEGFANYASATAAPASYEMSEEAKAKFNNVNTYLNADVVAADEDSNAEPIITGSTDTNYVLADMRGLAKDDPKWDDLMNQLTIDEMNTLIALGGYQTAAIDSISKIRTNDCDGPASINNNFTGQGSVGFPAAVMIAATWNKDIAHQFGDSIGKMANEMDTSGWYGPAMNIHRSAFSGRNFEYYSEDGTLSGIMAAKAIQGSQENGVYAYMKHFALNDQEGNRNGMLCTWSNEQAIREIYLKPFEISVKEANCLAVMSSFNYIGSEWTGGNYELCTAVLRGEWGFEGFVETDYFGVYGYMSSDQAIRNGTDLMLTNHEVATNYVEFKETNGAQQAMRTAAKNILYVVANSRAYEAENLAAAQSTPIWKIIMTVVDIAVILLLVLWEVILVKNYKKRSANEIEVTVENKETTEE